jgi:hypothetical protein
MVTLLRMLHIHGCVTVLKEERHLAFTSSRQSHNHHITSLTIRTSHEPPLKHTVRFYRTITFGVVYNSKIAFCIF